MRRNLFVLAVTVLTAILCVVSVRGQSKSSSYSPPWLASAWKQALSVPLLPTILSGQVPAVLPQTMTTLDANGVTTTYLPGGSVKTATNAFFQPLGTNGRMCFTCHQPQNDWSITPASILVTYATTQGRDPIFAPVDGADCPTASSHRGAFGLGFIADRTQLFTRGDFRISLPAPANAQWASVAVSTDPTGCERNPTYGLPAGMLSFYRRPLPATNTIYTSPGVIGVGPNIMWDGREPSLSSQFVDATLTHAQAAVTPSIIQISQGVNFESASFTAQTSDFVAGDLTGADGSGAKGGALNLYDFSNTLSYAGNPFAVLNGGSCSVPVLPCPGSLFVSNVEIGDFDGTHLYTSFFPNSHSTATSTARRESISRGEILFNSRSFNITGVTGLNDLAGFGAPVIQGTCSRCHNNANVGNDAFDDPKHIGISDNSYTSPTQTSANGSTTLPMSPDQPVFTFLCPVGSITYFSNPVTIKGVTYDEYRTSDPGMGWITGQCADLGKFKVPSLRGIGARAPFFHGGQAATMRDVVVFYNNRFSMNLTEQEIEDLVNYLNAL